MSDSLGRARAAIAAYEDTDNDEAWSEIEPLREGLRGITAEDALALMDDIQSRWLPSGSDHHLADEIITALLPESVRERYIQMQVGGWWYV